VRTMLGPAPAIPVSVEVAEGLATQVLLDRAAGAELLVLGGVASTGRDAIGPGGTRLPAASALPDRGGQLGEGRPPRAGVTGEAQAGGSLATKMQNGCPAGSAYTRSGSSGSPERS
jgi:hypothetical protein